MKKLLLLLLLFYPSSVYGQSFFENIFRDEEKEQLLQDSIKILLDDINFFIEYIESLEEEKQNYKVLYEKEKQNIKIRTVTKTVTETVRDTIRISPSGTNINTLFEIPFSLTQNMQGSIYKLNGITYFNWDYEKDKPINFLTEIDSFDLRLNVYTNLKPSGTSFIIETQPLTSNIIISDNQNNILSEDDYIRRVPTKLGIGLVGGFGFSYQGMTPYAGVGLTYSFLDIKEAIKKLKHRR